MHTLVRADCRQHLRKLADESVHCIVTSPPYYGLREYLSESDPEKPNEIGLKGSNYVNDLMQVSLECMRVLRRDGTLWLNIGDVYEDGNLLGLPWLVARGLQLQGWILRQDIIWAKASPMPESAKTRCTRSHEYVFMFVKSQDYFYDAEAIKEPCEGSESGKNRRSVWRLPATPLKGTHYATMPTGLAELCIKAGTSEFGCCSKCGAPNIRCIEKQKIERSRPNAYTKRTGQKGTGNSCANSVAGVLTVTTGWEPSCDCQDADDAPCVVLDPFAGVGTTSVVAKRLRRDSIGIELSEEYINIAKERLGDE